MARTEGKRPEPRQRSTAKPSPKRPTLPTVQDTAPSSGLGRKILFGGIGVVVLAVLVAFSFTLANEENPADLLPTADVAIEGDVLPPLVDPTNDTALGLPAPEVTSIDFAGEPASITNDGTPKLILFLAHWCQFCRREVPSVQAYLAENPVPEGVDFVSVATSNDVARPNYPPNAWLEREGWEQRIVLDDEVNSIATAYGLPAFPYYVVVDANGNVAQRFTGEQNPADIGLILQALATLPALDG